MVHINLTEIPALVESYIIVHGIVWIALRLWYAEEQARRKLRMWHVRHHEGRFHNCWCANRYREIAPGKQSRLDPTIAAETLYLFDSH
jgi:hypothetical protein